MKLKIFSLVLFLLCPLGGLLAADAGSRASYTRGGWAGARYAATGQCGAVLADDVYSIYWNPAGLSELKTKKKPVEDEIVEKVQSGNVHRITEDELINFSKPASEMNVLDVGISGTMLDVDRNAVFAGLAFGLFDGVIGFGAYSIFSLDIPAYGENGNSTGNADYSGSIGYVSYGMSLGMVSVGVSFKGLYEKIGEYSYAGAGLDAGSQVFVLPFLKLGFGFYDIGSGLTPVRGDRDTLERKYDLASPSFRINAALISEIGLTLVTGFVRKLEQSEYFWNFGVQYDVKEFLSIYAGMCDSQFSTGLTIRVVNLEISYAFVFDNIDGGVNNVVSASMLF